MPRNRSGMRKVGTATGFTLLEILLALSLLSIILAVLYSSFFLSSKALQGLDESVVRLQECRMFMDTIRRETEALYYLNAPGKNAVFKVEDRDLYGKQATRFAFNAFSSLVPGVSTISYYMDEKDGKVFLYKAIGQAVAWDNGTEVLDGVEAFTVEANNGDAWVKTWDSTLIRNLPAEIRITVTVMLKDRKVSLFEVVAPKLGKIL